MNIFYLLKFRTNSGSIADNNNWLADQSHSEAPNAKVWNTFPHVKKDSQN